jgi:hypothetical protein
MGEMEWVRLDSRKKEHDAIIAAISDFDRAGYLVSGVRFKDGALEVVCYPPDKNDGSSGPDLSMDGVSETLKV